MLEANVQATEKRHDVIRHDSARYNHVIKSSGYYVLTGCEDSGLLESIDYI